MTNIDDLQERISSAEAVLDVLKADLEDLKKQEQEQEPESLFGRWATHPERGRGIIISCKRDGEGEVRFAYRNGSYTDGVDTRFVRLESLDLDPVTLTTEQDFKEAPEGTIVEAAEYPHDVAVKTEGCSYRSGGLHAIAAAYMPTCRVIRWGNGQ